IDRAGGGGDQRGGARRRDRRAALLLQAGRGQALEHQVGPAVGQLAAVEERRHQRRAQRHQDLRLARGARIARRVEQLDHHLAPAEEPEVRRRRAAAPDRAQPAHAGQREGEVGGGHAPSYRPGAWAPRASVAGMRSSRLIAVACAIAASAPAAALAQEGAEEEVAAQEAAAEKTAQPEAAGEGATDAAAAAEGAGAEPAGDGGAIPFSHRGQVGLHLALGTGYRGIFPYDGEFCGDLKDEGGNAASCLGRSPLAIDLGLGYGITDRLEALLEVRL